MEKTTCGTLMDGGNARRASVADEVRVHAERVAAFADNLADRTRNRLESVMTSSVPMPAPGNHQGNQVQAREAREVREYPPLFEGLRGSLDYIEAKLRIIDEALDRVEL
jgi:hypothetical protein